MVDISDMLFIVGHVGHIWRSWETKLFETITKSKVFETNTTTFLRTNFWRSLLRLFWDQNFWDGYWDLFRDQNFRDRYWVFFFRPNIFETDTETFFRDLIFLKQIPRLFFETKIFETETDILKKLRKVSIPRSLETRCHTLLACELFFVYEYFQEQLKKDKKGMF